MAGSSTWNQDLASAPDWHRPCLLLDRPIKEGGTHLKARERTLKNYPRSLLERCGVIPQSDGRRLIRWHAKLDNFHASHIHTIPFKHALHQHALHHSDRLEAIPLFIAHVPACSRAEWTTRLPSLMCAPARLRHFIRPLDRFVPICPSPPPRYCQSTGTLPRRDGFLRPS